MAVRSSAPDLLTAKSSKAESHGDELMTPTNDTGSTHVASERPPCSCELRHYPPRPCGDEQLAETTSVSAQPRPKFTTKQQVNALLPDTAAIMAQVGSPPSAGHSPCGAPAPVA